MTKTTLYEAGASLTVGVVAGTVIVVSVLLRARAAYQRAFGFR